MDYLEGALASLKDVVSYDIFAYSLLGAFALVFVLCLIFGAAGLHAKMRKLLQRITDQIRHIEVDENNISVFGAQLYHAKRLKAAFDAFAAAPTLAPSKFIDYDMVLGGKEKHDAKVFDLFSFLLLSVTLILGVTTYDLKAVLFLLGAEVSLYAIFKIILLAVVAAGNKKLYAAFSEFSTMLDRQTVRMVADYSVRKAEYGEEEEDEDILTPYSVHETYTPPNPDVTGKSVEKPEEQDEEAEEDEDATQYSVPRTGYVNPYILDEQESEDELSLDTEIEETAEPQPMVSEPQSEEPLQEITEDIAGEEESAPSEYGVGYTPLGSGQDEEESIDSLIEEITSSVQTRSEIAPQFYGREVDEDGDAIDDAIDEDNAEDYVERQLYDIVKTAQSPIEDEDDQQKDPYLGEEPHGAQQPHIPAQPQILEAEEDVLPEPQEAVEEQPIAAESEKETISETVTETETESVTIPEEKQPAAPPVKEKLDGFSQSRDKTELEQFLERSKRRTVKVTPQELVDKAKLAESSADGGDESMRTMQQVALLLQKERERKGNKTAEDQRRMNEALADLLRAMGKNGKH